MKLWWTWVGVALVFLLAGWIASPVGGAVLAGALVLVLLRAERS